MVKIIEADVKSKYERDIVPDPSKYYVKDYPYYAAINYPEYEDSYRALGRFIY